MKRRNWKWNDIIQCWISEADYGNHNYYCLGDRMFHGAYGKERDDLWYHGSYVENWHGGIQTQNFQDALVWLYRAYGKGHENW